MISSRGPLLRAFWSLALLLSTAAAANAADLQVNQPWVREAPPGASVQAAYMQLHNGGQTALKVIAISSPDFARVEMHRTEMKDGMARMLPVKSLDLAPGETLSLAPGGYHLMLFEPHRALRAGDRVQLQLQLEDGGSVAVEAPVRRATGGGMPMQHMH